MKADEIPAFYDDAYAAAYDETFIHDAGYRDTPAFEVDVLRRLLHPDAAWLDVGCGTGYFLSQFQEADRAGLDLSPAMARLAAERNPTARFIREGDFRTPRPDWVDAWDVVSCMWCAYSYLETMDEVDQLLTNLADWTAPGGALFLPLCDIEDVTHMRASLPDNVAELDLLGLGHSTLDAVVWSYTDAVNGKAHRYLLSPHINHLTGRLKEHFERVDVVYYPPFHEPVPGQRKALVAAGKRGPVSDRLREELDAIQQASREHRARVLTVADAASRQRGWLRRAWAVLPSPLQQAVRKAIGEG